MARSLASFLLLTVFLLGTAGKIGAREEDAGLLASCGPIPLCRGQVANEECCKAISNSLTTQGCSCACKTLNGYGAPQLIKQCYENKRCPKCKDCVCTKSLEA